MNLAARPRHADGEHRVRKTDHPKRCHRVRPQGDARADLAQFARLLVNRRLDAGMPQGESGAKPADAAANYDHVLPR